MPALQRFPWGPFVIKERDVVLVEGQQRRQLGDVFCFSGITTPPLMAHGPQPLMRIPPGDALRRRYRSQQVRQRAASGVMVASRKRSVFARARSVSTSLFCAAVT